MGSITYIKNFLADANVGSVAPTSKRCVKRVCDRMDLDNAKLVVEFGPGGGVFTEYLVKNSNKDCKVVAIEFNKSFYDELKEMPSLQDERFELIHDNATRSPEILKELGLDKADYIISGIPLQLIEPDIKTAILRSAHDTLKVGGRLFIYQFFPPIYQKGKKLSYYLSKFFELKGKYFELPNIPPLYIFEAEKTKEVEAEPETTC